ncbi:cysteine hydrolase family protein [Pusillimonas caeni]|uniref:cysteine hydrolase family protein n=1 Tax=Pusillimonas caeni TaxID=1348472 RepID=UPI00142F578A|nr:isochorismatase family cysteine hydrolase [Pusillimonas caeni]
METIANTSSWKQADRMALLVIDLQNDFCSPDGYLAQRRGYKVDHVKGVLPNIRLLIRQARAAGTPIVWIRSHYDFKYINEAFMAKRGEEGCCLENTWGADFYEEHPAEGDIIVDKHSFSGFHGTNLDDILRQHGVKTLIVTGVATNVCVDSTLRDGFFRGYHIVLVGDAVGSNSQTGHDGTLATVNNNIGTVAPTAEVAQWLARNYVPA